MRLKQFFSSGAGTLLLSSESSTIVPKWYWHDCFQVRLTWLFPNETGTIVPKWHWHDCSEVRVIRLFPSKTGMVIPKSGWHDCSQVTLERFSPSDASTIVPKWRWHNYSQVEFDFLIYILFSSLFIDTWIVPCTRIMVHDPLVFLVIPAPSLLQSLFLIKKEYCQ